VKQKIDVFEYCDHICSTLKKGILLTTASGEEVNTMTIGWGHIGIQWGKPIFIAYVRESRYTRTLLDLTGEFTINVPLESGDGSVIRYCGGRSGRNCNKIEDLNLTLEKPRSIDVPGIKEFPLTLECKVIYRQAQDPSRFSDEILERYYPEDAGGIRDPHIVYYGYILDSYLIV